MNSIIEDLYYGRVDPREAPVKRSDELKKALGEASKAENFLRSKLDEDCNAALKTLLDAEEEDASCCTLDSYVRGFRHGARFMLDILMDGGEQP